jgi:hypothetical protein
MPNNGKMCELGPDGADKVRALVGQVGGLLLAISINGPEAVLLSLEEIEKLASQARHAADLDMRAAS